MCTCSGDRLTFILIQYIIYELYNSLCSESCSLCCDCLWISLRFSITSIQSNMLSPKSSVISYTYSVGDIYLIVKIELELVRFLSHN
jgi:hypothetical protein